MADNIPDKLKNWGMRNWLIASVFIIGSILIFFANSLESITKISSFFKKSELSDTVISIKNDHPQKEHTNSYQIPKAQSDIRKSSLVKHKLYDIAIIATPENCELYIDRSFYGLTNKTIFLRAGEYNISLSKEGYKTIKDRITIADSGSIRTYELTPL